MDKRGQGLSLNVIIIAALALIVLVVLVAVFTGRISLFQRGVSTVGDEELAQMRVQYGQCHPTASQEADFRNEFANADSAQTKDMARTRFEELIDLSASIGDASTCAEADYKWG